METDLGPPRRSVKDQQELDGLGMNLRVAVEREMMERCLSGGILWKRDPEGKMRSERVVPGLLGGEAYIVTASNWSTTEVMASYPRHQAVQACLYALLLKDRARQRKHAEEQAEAIWADLGHESVAGLLWKDFRTDQFAPSSDTKKLFENDPESYADSENQRLIQYALEDEFGAGVEFNDEYPQDPDWVCVRLVKNGIDKATCACPEVLAGTGEKSHDRELTTGRSGIDYTDIGVNVDGDADAGTRHDEHLAKAYWH